MWFQLVKGNIAIETWVACRNYAPFIKCITKVDGRTTDDTENLNLDMPMYNFLEYSSNYSDTTGSLWFYFKDEANNYNNIIVNNNAFKSFKYKTKLIGSTSAANRILAVPLKYLNDFWRSLEMPSNKCKVELNLNWQNIVF